MRQMPAAHFFVLVRKLDVTDKWYITLLYHVIDLFGLTWCDVEFQNVDDFPKIPRFSRNAVWKIPRIRKENRQEV